MCSSLAGAGTWGTGTLCSSAVAWEGKGPLETTTMSCLPKACVQGQSYQDSTLDL